MSDYEFVDIDEAPEPRFGKSDFAQVVFHNIQETYNTETNIQCDYTVTASLTPSNRDWIGLYR